MQINMLMMRKIKMSLNSFKTGDVIAYNCAYTG